MSNCDGYSNLAGQILKLSFGEASAYTVRMPLLPYNLLHVLNLYCVYQWYLE